MKATEVLMEEHRVIERVLTALEKGLDLLEEGKPIQPGVFENAAAFFKGFADQCHHQKEEKVLFVHMHTYGIPIQDGPIGVMLSEHEAGRRFLNIIVQAVQGWQVGDPEAFANLIKNGRDYIALLRQHIMKEDHILFPIAERVIPPDQHERIWVEFESVEHADVGEGVHEKYLQLAQRLESDIAIARSPIRREQK